MRILILGAGGVGGYFGGRLVEAGADVTFLVRSARQDLLRRAGLVIRSPVGNAKLEVRTIAPYEADGRFDIVIVACKAYDLAGTEPMLAPHLDHGALLLPMLNGMAHIDWARDRFGHGRVVGGVSLCSTTINAAGDQPNHSEVDPVLDALLAACKPAKFVSRRVDPIDQALWDKWVMLATLAGMTTLMRGSVGDIVATKEGSELMAEFLEETIAVATESEYPPGAESLARMRKLLFDPTSTFTASMLRDIEAGGPTEGKHIIGDMYHRARDMGLDARLLRVSYCHLQAYETRRKRERA